LVLSIPLTVCLVVLGRYVPYLRFLVVLLGDEPALAPPVRLFQRLLARDADEAEALVEEECEQHGTGHAFDTLLLPAVSLVDYERKLGRLDEEQIDEARKSFDMLAEAVERCAKARGECLTLAPGDAEPERSVLCLPLAAFGDEVVANLAVRIFKSRCLRAASSARVLTGEMIERIRKERPAVVLLSAMPPAEIRAIRHLATRLLGDSPDLQIVVGLWGAEEETTELRRQVEDRPIRVVTSFGDAMQIIEDRLRAGATAAEPSNGAREGYERATRTGAILGARTR
jgi:hypothetical protein